MHKIPLIALLSLAIVSPLYAEELSSCISTADEIFENESARILDTHTVKLSEISLEKEKHLKNAFSFFSFKQSLLKMKDIHERYKNEERKENDSFKERFESLKEDHAHALFECDKLSKEVLTSGKE